jgi:hypothetical protein
MGYIGKDRRYYVGDRIGDDIDAPSPPPSPLHIWEDGWVLGPIQVPTQVTMRQACQALILAGLVGQVDAALAAIPGVPGELARAEWEKSQVVERNRPLVAQMAAMLGLSSAQLDQLFITAAEL